MKITIYNSQGTVPPPPPMRGAKSRGPSVLEVRGPNPWLTARLTSLVNIGEVNPSD